MACSLVSFECCILLFFMDLPPYRQVHFRSTQPQSQANIGEGECRNARDKRGANTGGFSGNVDWSLVSITERNDGYELSVEEMFYGEFE
jgi:hypothetical protein